MILTPMQRKFRNADLMRTCSTLVVGVMLALALATADGSEAARLDQRVLMDPSRFTAIASVADLPAAVRELCVGKEGRMADPGQPFNAGCLVFPDSPPGTRMIWAAHSTRDGIYVLHYEVGGIAHSFHVLVVQADGRKISADTHYEAGAHRFENYNAFVAALQAHTIGETKSR